MISVLEAVAKVPISSEFKNGTIKHSHYVYCPNGWKPVSFCGSVVQQDDLIIIPHQHIDGNLSSLCKFLFCAHFPSLPSQILRIFPAFFHSPLTQLIQGFPSANPLPRSLNLFAFESDCHLILSTHAFLSTCLEETMSWSLPIWITTFHCTWGCP